MIFAAFGISETVTGFIWAGIFRPVAGVILKAVPTVFALGNLTAPWPADSHTAIWCLIVTFAAARSVPKSAFEAANVDGARPVAILRHSIAPRSMPGLRAAVFINLLGSLRLFDRIYGVTAGRPVRAT